MSTACENYGAKATAINSSLKTLSGIDNEAPKLVREGLRNRALYNLYFTLHPKLWRPTAVRNEANVKIPTIVIVSGSKLHAAARCKAKAGRTWSRTNWSPDHRNASYPWTSMFTFRLELRSGPADHETSTVVVW